MNYGEVVGDFFGDILGGIGDTFQAGGADAAAKAKYQDALADYVRAKANQNQQKTAAENKALQTAVWGVVIVLVLVVVGKFILPKLK